MQDQLEEIRQIKRKHENDWLKIDGIVAVGIGMTASKKMGIIISTKINPKLLTDKIPSVLQGIPIEMQHTGEIKAL